MTYPLCSKLNLVIVFILFVSVSVFLFTRYPEKTKQIDSIAAESESRPTSYLTFSPTVRNPKAPIITTAINPEKTCICTSITEYDPFENTLMFTNDVDSAIKEVNANAGHVREIDGDNMFVANMVKGFNMTKLKLSTPADLTNDSSFVVKIWNARQEMKHDKVSTTCAPTKPMESSLTSQVLKSTTGKTEGVIVAFISSGSNTTRLIRRNKSIEKYLWLTGPALTGAVNYSRYDIVLFHDDTVSEAQQHEIQLATPNLPLVYRKVDWDNEMFDSATNRFLLPRLWYASFLKPLLAYDWVLRLDEHVEILENGHNAIYKIVYDSSKLLNPLLSSIAWRMYKIQHETVDEILNYVKKYSRGCEAGFSFSSVRGYSYPDSRAALFNIRRLRYIETFAAAPENREYSKVSTTDLIEQIMKNDSTLTWSLDNTWGITNAFGGTSGGFLNISMRLDDFVFDNSDSSIATVNNLTLTTLWSHVKKHNVAYEAQQEQLRLNPNLKFRRGGGLQSEPYGYMAATIRPTY